MNILVVEDSTERHKFFTLHLAGHNLDIAIDYDDAITKLKSKEYDILYLDHDLEDEHYIEARKEYEIVKWMVKNENNKSAYIFIHSLNPIGAERMYSLLKSNGYKAERRDYLRLRKMAGL